MKHLSTMVVVYGYIVQQHRIRKIERSDYAHELSRIVVYKNLLTALLNQNFQSLQRRCCGRKHRWLASHQATDIGAKVTLISEGHKQVGLIKGGGSYLSTSDRRLLFGLGSYEAVDSLEVLWPSGKVTVRKNIEINQHLVLVEESL